MKQIREAIKSSLIQHFEADFLWKVSLKILNSGIILKTFTDVVIKFYFYICLAMQATLKELQGTILTTFVETQTFQKYIRIGLLERSLILFFL